jgi:hypothetical protein
VNNPWLGLPSKGPYVLPEDRPFVDAFNTALSPSSLFRIATNEVIPEPFVGAVATAPVLVLQLNPGYDETNPASHAEPDFREALLQNLRHSPREWPFYFFDPRFRDAHPGGRLVDSEDTNAGRGRTSADSRKASRGRGVVSLQKHALQTGLSRAKPSVTGFRSCPRRWSAAP